MEIVVDNDRCNSSLLSLGGAGQRTDVIDQILDRVMDMCYFRM